MNQVMKWNPFAQFENMQHELATLIDGRAANRNAVAEWAPVVDIIEDEKAYVIKAELPEMKKEDVHVQLENGVLTISGERKVEREEKTRKYHRIERAYGVFTRSFELPENIDANKISASYKEGVLTVAVAKSEQALPRQIEVKVN
jgi:HSP20 family protein